MKHDKNEDISIRDIGKDADKNIITKVQSKYNHTPLTPETNDSNKITDDDPTLQQPSNNKSKQRVHKQPGDNSDDDTQSKSKSKPKSQHITASQLTKMVKLDNLGLNDDYFSTFEPINIKGTLFPLNTPCYMTGQKGSGKTYLLASIVQYAYNMKEISRLFYIYAENIDNTIARAIPRKKIFAIPREIAKPFLQKFLRKKSKYTSCSNMLISYNASNGKWRLDENIENVPIYWDNLLDGISKNKHLTTLGNMVQYAERTVKKYNKGTQLNFANKYKFNLGRFTTNDFDFFIIDDIAQFMDLFGSTRSNSSLYPYFTITRQNKTTFYLTGQEVKQLPKMLREMLGAIVLLNGTNMNDINSLKLDSSLIDTISREFQTLKNHEGILYNFNDREMEIIKK